MGKQKGKFFANASKKVIDEGDAASVASSDAVSVRSNVTYPRSSDSSTSLPTADDGKNAAKKKKMKIGRRIMDKLSTTGKGLPKKNAPISVVSQGCSDIRLLPSCPKRNDVDKNEVESEMTKSMIFDTESAGSEVARENPNKLSSSVMETTKSTVNSDRAVGRRWSTSATLERIGSRSISHSFSTEFYVDHTLSLRRIGSGGRRPARRSEEGSASTMNEQQEKDELRERLSSSDDDDYMDSRLIQTTDTDGKLQQNDKNGESVQHVDAGQRRRNYGRPLSVQVTSQQAKAADRNELLYKVLVIGELGTGKTSIIKRYVHQFFSQHYRATIGVDFALKVIPWDENTTIRLQLWDIAGQERFGNMTRVYYKEAVGAFVVFDVTRSATFDAVLKWKQDLDSKVQLPDSGENVPCVLLANKCDQQQQKEGLVNSRSKMDEFCKENQFLAWFETSAKENINIDEAANCLVTKILQNDRCRLDNARNEAEGSGGPFGLTRRKNKREQNGRNGEVNEDDEQKSFCSSC